MKGTVPFVHRALETVCRNLVPVFPHPTKPGSNCFLFLLQAGTPWAWPGPADLLAGPTHSGNVSISVLKPTDVLLSWLNHGLVKP